MLSLAACGDPDRPGAAQITGFVATSAFLTLEALGAGIARHHGRVHLEQLAAALHLLGVRTILYLKPKPTGAHRTKPRRFGKQGRSWNLEVGEAPALVQLGEVARELHGVRLVDAVADGGGVGRRRAGFLARALARSHARFSRTGIPASPANLVIIF